MKKKEIILVFTLVFLFFSFGFLYAEVFHVTNGDEFQEALTDAADNDEDDTIFMATGIYQRISSSGFHYANFEYNSVEEQSLALRGEPGTSASDVIIDANSSGFCLSIIASTLHSPGEGIEDIVGDISITGIKLQNGNCIGETSGLRIIAVDHRVIINNCEIANNITGEDYGGVCIDSAIICMENNKILYNTCYDFRDIRENIIGCGGGLSISAFYTSFLKNNIIAYNSLITSLIEYDYCNGGGVYIYYYNLDDGSFSFINNTIYGNLADKGGGIYFLGANDTVLNFYNNIVYNNTARSPDNGNDISIRHFSEPTSTHIRINSHNNNYSGIVYKSILDGSYLPIDESSDNLNVDPGFVNARAGNFHLSPTSQMIGAGTEVVPTPPGLPDYDIDGYDRIYGSTIDIGADEYGLCYDFRLPFKARIIIMDIIEPEMDIKDVEKLEMKGMVFNENNDKGEIWILQVSKEGIKYFTKSKGWTTEKSAFYQGIIDKQTEFEINKFVISKTGLYDFYIIADKKIDGKITPDSFVIDSKTLLVIDDKQ